MEGGRSDSHTPSIHPIFAYKRERDSISWFTPYMPTTAGSGTEAVNQKPHLHLPHGWQRPTHWSHRCCLPGSASAGSRSQEQSWAANPGAPVWGEDTLTGKLATRPKALFCTFPPGELCCCCLNLADPSSSGQLKPWFPSKRATVLFAFATFFESRLDLGDLYRQLPSGQVLCLILSLYPTTTSAPKLRA